MSGYVWGIDPGMASTGVAVLGRGLSQSDGRPLVMAARVIRSQRGAKKELRAVRLTDDDQRRLRASWDAYEEMAGIYRPVAVGIEAYSPWKGRMGGSAWKVALAYQLAVAWAWHVGAAPMVFLPADLRRILVGRQGASKGDVGAALADRIVGLDRHLEHVPKGQHEHIVDGAAHAYLAWQSVQRLNDIFGGGRDATS